MENTENLLPEYSAKPKFEHTPATEREWLKIGRWAKFFAIYGFIYTGVNILGLIYLMIALRPVLTSNMFMLPPSMLWGFGILLLIFVGSLIAMFLGSRHHLQFAQNIQRALATEDQFILTSAWRSMKSAWKVYGIYTIILLGFYLITLTSLGYILKNNPYFGGF